MIFHITSLAAWSHAQRDGRLLSDSLVSEGFIHCATRAQVMPVANKYYKGQSGLCLLAIDESRLTSPVRWESPTGESSETADSAGLRFPHVFGPINLDSVQSTAALSIESDGLFRFPAALDSLFAT